MTKLLLPKELMDKILILSDNKNVMLKLKRYYALSKSNNIMYWAYSNGYLNFIKYLISIKIRPTKNDIEICIKYKKDEIIKYILLNSKELCYDDIDYYFYTQYIVFKLIEYNNYDIILFMYYEALYDYNFFNDSDFLIQSVIENKFYIAGFLCDVVGIKIPNFDELQSANYQNYIDKFNIFNKYYNIDLLNNKIHIIDYLIENKMNIEIKHMINEMFDGNYNYYTMTNVIDKNNIDILKFIYNNDYIEHDNEYINYAIYKGNFYCAKFLKDIFKLQYNKKEILRDFDDINETILDFKITLFENYCNI